MSSLYFGRTTFRGPAPYLRDSFKNVLLNYQQKNQYEGLVRYECRDGHDTLEIDSSSLNLSEKQKTKVEYEAFLSCLDKIACQLLARQCPQHLKRIVVDTDRADVMFQAHDHLEKNKIKIKLLSLSTPASTQSDLIKEALRRLYGY
ncbi:MAG TPA: hypothetical protein V6C52_11235 [Coleofasciculaceae cyanobacterium]|jgi:hypothetical protein